MIGKHRVIRGYDNFEQEWTYLGHTFEQAFRRIEYLENASQK